MRSCWPVLLFVLLVLGCWRDCSAPLGEASDPLPIPVEAPGLHNVYRLTDRLYSGSSPEGEVGFRSLRSLGIRTVLTVDGAKPDVAGAGKFGLRYVHLPIGYDGVPRQQGLRIGRAVRDLPGPVYLHCHHGKHRGPAAAAVVLLCLDESYPVERAVAWLRLAGTDPRYKGLHAAPRQLRRPTREELERVPADFPAVAEVGGLARLMVEVDQRWDHLGQAREAGWRTPSNHPDIDPPHEALQLVEAYREAVRLPGVREARLRRWFAEAEEEAKELERALRGKGGVERAAAEKAFRALGAACLRCHARYRDVPRGGQS